MSKKGWKRIIFWAPLLLLSLTLTFSFEESFAQKKGYPEKPIKIIVPVNPGGQSDLAIRSGSEELSKKLGVSVFIVNEAGGGGTIAAAELSKAKPDGYTLFGAPMNTMLIAPAMNPKINYSINDFTPVCMISASPMVCAVNSTSPFKTIEALLDYAKKNPGKLNGGAPVASTGHLDLELIKYHAKVDIVTVPFKGSPEGTTALLGNHIDVYVGALAPLLGHLRSGRLRGLMTTNKLKELPDIPLFSEKGLAQAGMTTWVGILAPLNLPKEIQKKLVDAYGDVMKEPGVLKTLDNAGFAPYYVGPEAMAKIMHDESERVIAIVKATNIKQD